MWPYSNQLLPFLQQTCMTVCSQNDKGNPVWHYTLSSDSEYLVMESFQIPFQACHTLPIIQVLSTTSVPNSPCFFYLIIDVFCYYEISYIATCFQCANKDYSNWMDTIQNAANAFQGFIIKGVPDNIQLSLYSMMQYSRSF